MPKKIRSHGSIQNGSRMFTDREEPRQAFWEKYRAVKGQLHTDGDIHVLTYYGVGGIGKTSLLKQLMLEMDRQLPSPRYVYLDLDKHHDCHTVLNVLKNMLGACFMSLICLIPISVKYGAVHDTVLPNIYTVTSVR